MKSFNKTNKELAREMNTTPRQISKSRKRGWIWVDGKRVNYKASTPVFYEGYGDHRTISMRVEK